MAENLSSLEEAKQWFIEQIRIALLDYEELNELIAREEVGDTEIKHAVNRAIEEFNSLPPPLSAYTFLNFPSKEILILGTISNLLLSGAILHFRNQLNYNAGGISVSTHDKGPAYQALSERINMRFKKMSEDLKASINVSAMLNRNAGIGSDYGLLNWYWNSSNPATEF
jgi:hypothetical protein